VPAPASTRASFLTLLLLACSTDPPPAPARAPARDPDPARSAAGAPARTPRPEHLRTSSCTASTPEGAAIAPDNHVPLEQVLVVAAGDTCKLVRDDLVLKLHGPARALALPHGEVALLLREGMAELDLAAGRATPGSGLWLSTPGVRVELVQGARLVVRVLPAGGTQLRLVSGQARIQPLGRGEAVRELGAGDGLSVASGGRASAITQRKSRMEDALAGMSGLPRPDGRPRLEELIAVTRDTLAQVEAGRAQLGALARDHDQRVARGGAGAMELQRQIATQSGAQLAAERLLRAQEAALEAWTLDADVRDGEPARELLGRIHAR
jgi:hypothetical protein